MNKLKKIVMKEGILVTDIAKSLKVSKQLVYRWLNEKDVKDVGAHHCVKLCKFLKGKLTPHDLRPDVFDKKEK